MTSEVFAALVPAAIFKIDRAGAGPPAGSIPVHLRHSPQEDTIDQDVQRRRIPSVDVVLQDERLAPGLALHGRERVREAVRRSQHRIRSGALDVDGLVADVLSCLNRRGQRPVVNATGVLVHTNLGRAPLSAAAIEAITISAGYTDVEFDLDSGQRARRGRGTLDALAQAVPLAGGVHVVNNNAAALVLAATALAQGRDIIISKGELVEIGDGFRIPDLLVSTGARLREVGTTNRTTVQDYRAALGPDTGFILKVHRSNFALSGFTAEASTTQLATLGAPVVCDTGSGLLRPEPLLPAEPDVTTSLRDGAQLVMASGDKLLGGPQCGLLFGEGLLIERLRRHPLARALRVDKLTLAAIEATVDGPLPPITVFLRASLPKLTHRATRLASQLRQLGEAAEVCESQARIGGGGGPEVSIPSIAVAVRADLAAPIRCGTPAIVGRVLHERLLLDLRTILPEQDRDVVAAVAAQTQG